MSEIEKAIKAIKLLYDYNVYGIKNSDVNMAIEALEKQIPKKPFDFRKRKNFNGDVILLVGNCPVCEEDIDSTCRFCKHCGESIDWRVEG